MTSRRTSKRKTSRKPKKAPARSRKTSRRVRPNTIPPPPNSLSGVTGPSEMAKWVEKTFPSGTPVRFKVETQVIFEDGDMDDVPAGTIGTIGAHGPNHRDVEVVGALNVPLFTSSAPRPFSVTFSDWELYLYLQPLVDHWGPLVPPKRHSPKMTQGWQKQLARSRRVRAMRPNATCPSCGSQHYFEGMWDRDCAEPGCIYYRGGSVAGSPEPAATGARQILITFDTTTPESAAEGEYEESGERETIEQEAEDLDDETWAEWAAGVIADKLGYVDDNGNGTYYQSEWHVTDYSTGEEERLAAHLHPPEAWRDDLVEIHRLLKKRKLVHW